MKAINDETDAADPAGVFACAVSLFAACEELRNPDRPFNLSTCFGGIDELMRVVMRAATSFENWANQHVNFDELDDVWSYSMQESFGRACTSVVLPERLSDFNEADCLRVATHPRLPLRIDTKLPLALSESAVNPVAGSEFASYRVVTMRAPVDGHKPEPLTADDNPFDARFLPPYSSLFGVTRYGKHEHLADRNSYAEVVALAGKLAPGIEFPRPFN